MPRAGNTAIDHAAFAKRPTLMTADVRDGINGILMAKDRDGFAILRTNNTCMSLDELFRIANGLPWLVTGSVSAKGRQAGDKV